MLKHATKIAARNCQLYQRRCFEMSSAALGGVLSNIACGAMSERFQKLSPMYRQNKKGHEKTHEKLEEVHSDVRRGNKWIEGLMKHVPDVSTMKGIIRDVLRINDDNEDIDRLTKMYESWLWVSKSLMERYESNPSLKDYNARLEVVLEKFLDFLDEAKDNKNFDSMTLKSKTSKLEEELNRVITQVMLEIQFNLDDKVSQENRELRNRITFLEKEKIVDSQKKEEIFERFVKSSEEVIIRTLTEKMEIMKYNSVITGDFEMILGDARFHFILCGNVNGFPMWKCEKSGYQLWVPSKTTINGSTKKYVIGKKKKWEFICAANRNACFPTNHTFSSFLVRNDPHILLSAVLIFPT